MIKLIKGQTIIDPTVSETANKKVVVRWLFLI